MQTIEKSVTDGDMVPALYGLSSRVGNASLKAEVTDSMSAFFDRMELMTEPHASKVVRIETKIVMKDGDDDVELPSNFTKRGMYERGCLDRGWVAKARDGNGSYGRIAKYETRNTQEGTDWPLESVSLPVWCFKKFISYWRKFFLYIKIKKSSHHTCG